MGHKYSHDLPYYSAESSSKKSGSSTEWEKHFFKNFSMLFTHMFLAKGKEIVTAIAEAQKAEAQIWFIDRPNWVSAQRFDACRREAMDDSSGSLFADRREVYVYERDEWMVGQLQARIDLSSPDDKMKCIVCVVSLLLEAAVGCFVAMFPPTPPHLPFWSSCIMVWLYCLLVHTLGWQRPFGWYVPILGDRQQNNRQKNGRINGHG
jgi:hypothetical protein